jgi:hypothetical protein
MTDSGDNHTDQQQNSRNYQPPNNPIPAGLTLGGSESMTDETHFAIR